jgi:putative ABC transport system permease protein
VAPSTLVPILRRELAAIDPNLPMSDVKTMAERYGEATWRTWILGTLLGLFAALALILAVVGIFGVLAQSVAQRTREIGVRMALGARSADIVRLIVSRGFVLLAVGAVCGLAGAVTLTRFLEALLYQVRPIDPVSFIVVTVLLVVIALLACWLPTRRAMRVDPAVALRVE